MAVAPKETLARSADFLGGEARALVGMPEPVQVQAGGDPLDEPPAPDPLGYLL